MRKAVFATLIIAMASVAVAEKKEKKKDDRWKISFSGSVAGPGEVLSTGRDNICYRCQDGLAVGRAQFDDDYLGFNNARPNSIQWDIPARARSRSYNYPTVDVFFRTRSGDFRGNAGDEYFLKGFGRTNDYREQGAALGGSLEYRVTGGVWLAFSGHVSRTMIVSRSEGGEYLRVESIGQGAFSGPTYRQTWDPYLWHMRVSRHRIARESEHKHRFFSYVLMGKFDLTRGNNHWSVLPQVGIEALLERRESLLSEQFVPFSTFAVDDSSRSISWETSTRRSWHERYLPVAGLSLELYPGGKNGFASVFVDGRYRFHTTEDRQVYTFKSSLTNLSTEIAGRNRLFSYDYASGPSDWSVVIGGLVRF